LNKGTNALLLLFAKKNRPGFFNPRKIAVLTNPLPRMAAYRATILFLLLTARLSAQLPDTLYQYPADALVRAKLDAWQDLKFGIILHWGLYSVPGIIESWALCSEDWIERDSTVPYDEFKRWYWGLKDQFNPTAFDPGNWAETARAAGMRYVVFTTKHHDGFCMFDTKQTDFSIAAGPFAGHARANVARHVFDAFRQKGLMVGAYFSKPDWHSEYYWWPKYATADRNNNYDIRRHPWRWQRFKDFTYQQLYELTHEFGPLDILWLDGGWVRPLETVNAEVRSWGARIPAWSQDIDLPKIAAMARQAQPALLIVDRTVHGPYENYRTPEQRVPATPLPYPWESCMTLADNWGYVPGDRYKTPEAIIHTLIEVVSKGGNLLLGVGPKPDGTLPEEALTRLGVIGRWLEQNGAALYGSRPATPYRDGSTFFTQSKDGRTTYALVRLDPGQTAPATVEWRGLRPRPGTKIVLLATGKPVRWTERDGTVRVTLPAAAAALSGTAALAFAFAR
jgi:alpha-L-fucosidase